MKRKIKRKRNKEVVAAQSPQGLKRCADAQYIFEREENIFLAKAIKS